MKLVIDYDRCQGHGQCQAVAPNLFEVGADDRAHLCLGPDADVPETDRAKAEDAIAVCPEAAISWLKSAI